jgi:hypothetical protein
MRRIDSILTLLAITLLAGVERVDAVTPPNTVVLDFDDIQVFPADSVPISGTNYHGLEWGTSTVPGFQGHAGFWLIDDGSDDPLGQGLVNGWAAPELEIKFPSRINLISTLASAQGTPNLSAPGIRIRGYRDGQLTMVSPWFTNLVRHQPNLFSINISQIDSIIVEAQSSSDAVAAGERWGAYRLDNFTFVSVPEPRSIGLASVPVIIALFARAARRGR